MTEVADLYVVLRSVGAKFEEGMARAGGAAEAADAKIATVGRSIRMLSLAAVGGGVLVAGAALKMSSSFDRAMEQLHTLAHVPQSALHELSGSVLNVAGVVGFAPNSLAAALYHIESTFASVGISSHKAMGILTTAAKGAQIGNADLVDVVNALDAAVVSGIPGVKNINQAMGALLATVGAGDMTMQNLAEALGSGILAIAKQYGVTLADTGAALATFGDNNIRGSKAATDLRMVIMDLTKQSSAGMIALGKIGVKAGELGAAMRKGGLNAAILDLHNRLSAAGVKGTEVGAVLTEAFTKRSSAPLAILLGELHQFESKFPELKKGANSFGDSWKHTAAEMALKFQDAKANIEAAFIGLGHMLTPVAGKIMDAFNGAFAWAKTHKKTIEQVAHALSPVLLGAAIVVAGVLAEMAIEAAIAAAPFILLAAAVGFAVKWFMNLYEHNAKVRAFVQTLVVGFKKDATEAVHWLIRAFQDAKRIVGEVIDAIVGFYHSHQAAIDGMVSDTVGLLKALWQTFKAGFDAVKAIVITAIHIIEDLWARFGSHLWSHIVTAWNAMVEVFRGAFQIIKGLFEIVTGILTGNWSKFWKGIEDVFGGAWKMIVGLAKAFLNELSLVIGAGMAVISAAWGLIWHWIEDLAKLAWKGIKFVAVEIFDFYIMLPIRILKYLGNTAMSLFNAGKNFMLGLLRGIASMAPVLWDWAKGVPGALFKLLDKAYDYLLNVGKDVVIGIWNGIASMAGWLWHKIEDWLGGGVLGKIASFLGINSPSKVMRDLVGKNMVLGMAQGITENQHHVHDALKKIATDAANTQFTTGKIWPGLAGSGGKHMAGGYGAPGAGSATVYNITVQGTVVDTAGLFRAMQTATQQHGARNSSTGLVFSR